MDANKKIDGGKFIDPRKMGSNDPVTADALLAEMGFTYKERNKVYGDNYQVAGRILELLMKDMPAEKINWTSMHLIHLMVVKLTRFANSQFTHRDSIHDLAVYSAMVEAVLLNSGEDT